MKTKTDNTVEKLAKQLADAKAKQKREHEQRDAKLREQLENLHVQVDGVDSREELMAEMRRLFRTAGNGKGGKSTPQDVVDKIVAELKDGATGASLAEKYNLSAPTISKIRASHGLAGKGGRKPVTAGSESENDSTSE